MTDRTVNKERNVTRIAKRRKKFNTRPQMKEYYKCTESQPCKYCVEGYKVKTVYCCYRYGGDVL